MEAIFGTKKQSQSNKFRDAINDVNEAKKNQNGGENINNFYPGIWLRDYNKDIETPMKPNYVKGEIPDWLSGRFIRNGPGKMSFGETAYQHVFDFSAVLHSFTIEKGSCTYQSKLLKSDAYKKNLAAQRIVVSEFGTVAVPDPCKSIFDRFSSIFSSEDLTDNCVVAIYPYGDEVYAMTESPMMQKIDPATLDTIKLENVSKYFEVVFHSAHPHVTQDGTIYNSGLSVSSGGPKYSIVSYPPSKDGSMLKEGKIECQVPARWSLNPSYMHSFGITENYFIIIEQPLAISIPQMFLNKFRSKAFSNNLTWYDNHDTIIHVVNRKDKSIKKFPVEKFFFFHTINQFEDSNGNIVMDVCAYKDANVINCLYLESMKEANSNPDYASLFRSRPIRLTLPLDKSGEEVVPEVICELGCELPRFNQEYLGKCYRYFYAISSDWDLENPGVLIKVDTLNKTCKTWGEAGHFPSEPIFVPKPQSEDEDDGVVVSALLSSKNKNQVTLIVLDGKSFNEIFRAVFNTEDPVPNTFHGWFFN